jgi:steroid 5-alpha reductase family enzyme
VVNYLRMQRDFAWIVVAYVAAFVVAVVVALTGGWQHPIAVAFAADVAATIVVFAFSVAFGNSSFYDAYWSVIPPLIAVYWALCAVPEVNGLRQAVVIALVWLWGARLTYNWARGWGGLGHEDWRYVDLRGQTGAGYWPVSFVGLHMMPTLQVFLGCLSLYPALVVGARPFGLLDCLAVLVTAGAIWIEARADKELVRFRRSQPPREAILDTGVWAYSRHPNYFGEMSFWWGLFLFGLSANPSYWWTIVGPVAITLLFRFASLPLIETRMLSRRPGFAAHQQRVSMVIPWFPR